MRAEGQWHHAIDRPRAIDRTGGREAWTEAAVVDLPWKDEMGPLTTRPTLEPLQTKAKRQNGGDGMECINNIMSFPERLDTILNWTELNCKCISECACHWGCFLSVLFPYEKTQLFSGFLKKSLSLKLKSILREIQQKTFFLEIVLIRLPISITIDRLTDWLK